ncbi:exonuclease VIII [Salmonella enterica subsp. enterica serovar Typhimurium str. DT104]|nr:exonuclease VIII [Salmonella enterica subsp. enterica serovar Typhimurium str. DT104]
MSAWIDRYEVLLQRRNLSVNTYKIRSNQLATVREKMGEIILAEVTTRHIAKFLESWITEGKNTMAGAMRSVLSDMFREAIVEGHIVKNPVEATRIPEIKVARERLQLETYNATRAAAEHMPAWFPLAMDLALVTGQRREDIVNMKFSDVFDNRLYVTQIKTGMKIAIPLSLTLRATGNGNPDLRRTWCESFLAVHGVRDPDWYEYVPDNTPTTHEENAARLRQAGKCLRDIETGRFQCDEEKPQPTGELADEPATPEAVEQDTTEHHPDPQPLENEPPVSQTEAGYQKIRAELHEARKNIPPKNPVDVGKQLAAARGEYVEGISDPDDPKWVHNNYSASNQGEKEEVVPEEKQPAAEPEAVTRNADGTFDVSALFPPPSNQTEKTEARTERDGETPKESNQQETAGDTGQEITTDGGSGTGGDEAGEAADPVENGNFTVPDDIQPGIYYDIPNEAYHAGPGVSKSQLDDIADTPAIYLWRKNAPVDTEKTKTLDTGTAFHCRILEPEEFSKRFIIAPEFNRRTSAGKEEEKTFLEECARTGRTVLTAEEGRKIELMYQSVMALPLGQWLVESAGYAESSVYWEDPETGILCRCRPDKIIPEFHWIMDVKTTADIQRFRTAYYDYRYHVQDAFYSDGYRAQFGEIPTFVFLVASTTAECGRYPVEIFMMGEDAKLAGQREYRRNLQTLAECLNNDEWPAIKTLSLPRWAKENANA